ncbi:MAG: hypothetical protein Q8M76_14650, partial [Spirochaetaceae bacterium]|nr:hypothetical protein [Spirochaetaceae bacterium]
MRVALVVVPAGSPEALSTLAKSMARVLESAGHRVDVAVAGVDETPRLAGYDYVIVGSEPLGWGGKIPAKVGQMLSQAGMVGGKRSMAFLRKAGLFPAKAMKRLMSAMEAEGM